jgi:hypothetical protein
MLSTEPIDIFMNNIKIAYPLTFDSDYIIAPLLRNGIFSDFDVQNINKNFTLLYI